MTSRHYKWQTRWTLDIPAGIAVHDSGFIVAFSSGTVGQALNADAILPALTAKNGGHNAPLMIDRMLREARQLHTEAMQENTSHV